jgi:ABC-type multidrug transport system ATPase subunit
MTLAYLSDRASEGRLSPFETAEMQTRIPSVRIRNLTKSFPVRRGLGQILRHPLSRPRATVVRGVSFDVAPGEMFGILGLNGAGKTTLLKMLATLIVPDSGTADIGDHDVVDDSLAVREIVAMVSAEERSLNWRLSANENLRVFAGLHRMSTREAATRIADVLVTVGLDGSGDKLVGAYSSGMRQRLLLARALLAAPRVLLMDEPTRSLDPVSAHEFRRMLREDIVDGGGATVVLATHNPEEAFSYCDRAAVIHHGRLAALGSGRELATRFGQNIYRIWTTTPDHPGFEVVVRRGLINSLSRRNDPSDGSSVECVIPGDEMVAAEVLRRLVEARVSVSRFERAPSSLSTLIARIVEKHESSLEVSDA